MSGRPNGDRTAPAGATNWQRPDLGFRSVSLVRVWIDGAATHFEVLGVRNRRPITLPITAGMAARFVAAGTPLVMRDFEPELAEPIEVA